MNIRAKIKILVLAAGQGTRMKSELPKVLTPFQSQPMIKHLLESIDESGIDPRPTIVVGHKKEEVMEAIGTGYDYAVQDKQLGTGHAVISAQKFLENKAENIMVLPSDHPFISAKTLSNLAEKHLESGGKITMATVKLPDFDDWRSVFYNSFSRIIRDESGNIIKDVQYRDATDEEKKITEVNPIFFCFNASWLWEKLKTLDTNNDQKQYYLTDLVKKAIEEGEKITTITIDPHEALAANSKEELEILEKFA